jgi:hypothetical protein
MLCGADHQYPIVPIELLFVKYMRVASIIDYGLLHMVLICKVGGLMLEYKRAKWVNH